MITKTQSRIESLVEGSIQIAIGFVINIIAGVFIYPFFGHTFSISELTGITVAYTFISLARQYYIRRAFNNGLHKLIHRTITGLFK